MMKSEPDSNQNGKTWSTGREDDFFYYTICFSFGNKITRQYKKLIDVLWQGADVLRRCAVGCAVVMCCDVL
jgi:hypothetical protein